ncbi:glycosyl transferase [Vibrio azureus]|uniref:Glycosyltransferase n=1 Tax=Vibrio azureus NBRC 104587 TaxID=1219077 RepID=U3A2S0_9VIBR|nr:glycosyltransferase [Vibrio azureus]AUI85984.1 glycosyl transferase [Vibrio azureus]GAD74291.1 hypothetical protein VAZ01S_008_00330 [Vibrio azureus NBRC 104587]
MTDIVVFGEDFGGLPSSTQHIVKQLASNHRILWVNSIGLRQPKLCVKDTKRLFYKLTKFFATKKSKLTLPITHCSSQSNIHNNNLSHPFENINNSNANIKVIDLITIPAPHSALARTLATKMMQNQLVRALQSLNFVNPIYWTSLPTAADICLAMNARATIYYCGDDFGSLAGVDHEVVLKHEQKLVESADIIFSASDKLSLTFPEDKTITLHHGVDYDLFTKPAIRATDFPTTGRKVLGFYGSLSNWLDYELIEQVARKAKDWDLIFIGKNECRRNHLPKMNNVFYLGPRPHHSLPSYSQHWDASWLPFINNAQINACNPLKLLEYLCAGRPIISTPFPALAPYIDIINIAEDADAVCHSLNHPLPPPKTLKDELKASSWQSVAEKVDKLVRAL